MTVEAVTDVPKDASKARDAGLRRALLLFAALLLGWLAYNVYTSMNELDATVQKIYVSLVTESK